jgi:cytochrome P450
MSERGQGELLTANDISEGRPANVSVDRYRVFNYTSDPLKAATPFDAYLEFRGEPAFWSPVAGGFWVLTDASSIRDCYQDPSTFSNRNLGLGYTDYSRRMIPEQLDPPEHGKYRRLLAPFFTPGAVSRLEADARGICGSLLDEVLPLGQGDFVELFTGKYPQVVFLRHILNLPLDDLDTFLGWEHNIMRHPRDPETAEMASKQLWDYLRETIADRLASPIDGDLLSELLAGTVDERPVTEDEVLDTTWLLFLAGLDTVTAALSFSFHFLATHPKHRRQLIGDPSLVSRGIEELLRYHSFVSPVRTATRDVEFHGIELREGDRVLPASVLAARDPEEFDRPDEMIFDRAVNRHMAFGAGPHRCLGSHLARLEMRVAIGEFHRRVSDYELAPGGRTLFHAAGTMGIDALPLGWSVADVVGMT